MVRHGELMCSTVIKPALTLFFFFLQFWHAILARVLTGGSGPTPVTELTIEGSSWRLLVGSLIECYLLILAETPPVQWRKVEEMGVADIIRIVGMSRKFGKDWPVSRGFSSINLVTAIFSTLVSKMAISIDGYGNGWRRGADMLIRGACDRVLC